MGVLLLASGLVVGFFKRCLKVLRPVLFARLFKTVLHALAPSGGNWQWYCEATLLTEREQLPKGKRKPPTTKEPSTKLIYWGLYLCFQCSSGKTPGSTELLKSMGHCWKDSKKLLNIYCYLMFRRDLLTVFFLRIKEVLFGFVILRITSIKNVTGPSGLPSELFVKCHHRGPLGSTTLS